MDRTGNDGNFYLVDPVILSTTTIPDSSGMRHWKTKGFERRAFNDPVFLLCSMRISDRDDFLTI